MKYSELKNILRIYYSESMIGKILAPNILQKPSIKNAVILEKSTIFLWELGKIFAYG